MGTCGDEIRDNITKKRTNMPECVNIRSGVTLSPYSLPAHLLGC